MNPLERFAALEDGVRTAIKGDRVGLWTALPGIIVSFNTDKAGSITAVIQPAIKGVIQSQNGTYEAVNLPVLPDVPVVFPRGGGCTLTFPIQVGDECLVIFSSRCIDGWWQSGGIQLPMDLRMHDLSDGFAILGPQSQTRKIENISTDAVQLRSDDGLAYVQLNPTNHYIDVITPTNVTASAGGNITASAGGTIDASAGSSATVTAPTITLNGDVTINGNVSLNGSMGSSGSIAAGGDVTAGSISLNSHIHGGVTPGPFPTGGPQ